MPGEIKHYWSGTTLMIESDSGVSGCDLKGRTGDIGPRGPQGKAGILFDEDGDLVIGTELWTFVLTDGTTVTKAVYVG